MIWRAVITQRFLDLIACRVAFEFSKQWNQFGGILRYSNALLVKFHLLCWCFKQVVLVILNPTDVHMRSLRIHILLDGDHNGLFLGCFLRKQDLVIHVISLLAVVALFAWEPCDFNWVFITDLCRLIFYWLASWPYFDCSCEVLNCTTWLGQPPVYCDSSCYKNSCTT